jgi:hypothetical protein
VLPCEQHRPDRYESREHFIAEIALASLEHGGGGGPDLIEVTEEVRRRFLPREKPPQATHVRPRTEDLIKQEISELKRQADALQGERKLDEAELNRRAMERLAGITKGDK